MALLTLTVNDATRDTRAQEVALISRALNLAAHDIRAAGGAKTSGNINDDFAVTIGTWTYTPGAAS